MSPDHVVVFLGSRWAALEHQATRWREVLVRWRATDPATRLTLVDWPALSTRAVLPGGSALVEEDASWLPGSRLLQATVPVLNRPTPVDDRGWRRVGEALAEAIGGPADLALSANPLWNPVLPHIDARRRTFDAVDDWRGHPVAERVGPRVEQGYRAAADLDLSTANSPRLAERLHADFGLTCTVVTNGVDLDAFASPAGAPDGLPSRPFAVYVGVVQERVDVDLLCALAAAGPLDVVVAGPATDAALDQLRRSQAIVLGSVPHELVPGLLRRAAVGLVPHHVNEFTTSMDPMKLLEYLAAGLPVVTTPLPGVSDLSRRVLVADGVAEFVSAVREANDLGVLRGPDPAVRDRDWDTVAARLLAAHLGGPG